MFAHLFGWFYYGHMAICVTEQMTQAAARQLPGVRNTVRIRAALEAALELVPDSAETEVPVTARIRLQIDEEQLRTDVAAILAQQQAELDMPQRYIVPDFDKPTDDQMHRFTEELEKASRGPFSILSAWVDPAQLPPHVTLEGLEGDGVIDATGSATAIPVNEPRILAGLSEIGARLGAPRSTIATWVKNRPDNGMPAPIATLKAGPVYDLDAVEAWYRAWKAGG